MASVEDRVLVLEAAKVELAAKVAAVIEAVKDLTVALQPTFCIQAQHNLELYPNGILDIQGAQKAALVAAEAALAALE